MSKKHKSHITGLNERLLEYTEARVLDFHQYSPYHMRISDGGYVILDAWTTARYYIVMTDYQHLLGAGVRERGGEKGTLDIDNLWPFLDAIFFGEDMSQFTDVHE